MLRSLIRILHASMMQIDTEMAEKYAKQQLPAVCSKFAFGRYAAGYVSALMGLVTLTTDLLTLKLVCESHLTFIPNMSKLGLNGFSNYSLCTRRTDRRKDRQKQRNAGAG